MKWSESCQDVLLCVLTD